VHAGPGVVARIDVEGRRNFEAQRFGVDVVFVSAATMS